LTTAKSKRVRLLILALVLGIAGGGAWWWQQNRIQGNEANRLTLYGNVDIRQVDLAFNGNERITRMLVQEGDHVKDGQLLAELATQRLAAQVAGSAAGMEAQRQVVARLEAGTRPEEIKQARAEVELATAQAHDAQLSYRRIRDLAARKVASQQQVDDAKAALDTATARLKAAQAALDLALAGPRKEDIAAAKATLAANEAQLALAQRQLEDAFLYASADGVIRNRILEPGDMASPERPVYTLALTDPIWIRAYVDEPDLGKIFPGMIATITTDSYPGKTYQGWVGYISPAAEFTPKSVQTQAIRTSLVYQIRVFVCNPANQLRLGMPVTVAIDLDQSQSATNSPDTDRCRIPNTIDRHR
jgi:HlyD family secretion protein